MKPNTEKTDCLITCHGEHCSSSQCCSRENFLEDACKSVKDADTINRRYDKKEKIPAAYAISLKRFTINEEETLEQTVSDSKKAESVPKSTNENACHSNDKQIQGVVNVNSEISACTINLTDRISTNVDTDKIYVTADSNLDHSVV